MLRLCLDDSILNYGTNEAFTNSAAPIKRTAVERQVNVQIVFLFVFLLGLSLASTIGSSIQTVSELFLGEEINLIFYIGSGSSQVINGTC